mmetsp:Transcript_65170/g.128659  ORF Transcript_65170/g.128659 Transcript_65170/m.128659 type:complete len:251 (+) Transcript_65170:88-840(+)
MREVPKTGMPKWPGHAHTFPRNSGAHSKAAPATAPIGGLIDRSRSAPSCRLPPLPVSRVTSVGLGRSSGSHDPPARSDALRVDGRVRLCSLRSRPALNGKLGACVHWDGVAERWDVKLDDGLGHVRVKPENLEAYFQPTLVSNEGWRGRSVRSWVFGDEQERVSQAIPTRLVTVHANLDQGEARASFVSMSGEEVMTIDPSLLREMSLGQVLEAVARSCNCQSCEVQLLRPSGEQIHGLDHWRFASSLQP